MKKVIVGLLILMFVGAIVGLTYLSTDFKDTQIKLSSTSDKDNKKQVKPKYHFVAITQSMDDPFWQDYSKGVQQAAKDFNVAVEINGPEFININEQLRYLDIAIASRADGIATSVLGEQEFTPLINKASSGGIPVVTVGSDAKGSQRVSFIGSSSYKLGIEAGKLVINSTGGQADVAIILSNYYAITENVLQNVMVGGFIDSVKDYKGIDVKTVQTASTGHFSAEEIARNILKDYPTVDMIICTNPNDTLGVAQVLIDFYKVGKVKMIGYSDNENILNYVKSQVIYGTVVEDPYKIGYESIRLLVEAKDNGRPSTSYSDTGIKTITRQNVDQILNQKYKAADKNE